MSLPSPWDLRAISISADDASQAYDSNNEDSLQNGAYLLRPILLDQHGDEAPAAVQLQPSTITYLQRELYGLMIMKI